MWRHHTRTSVTSTSKKDLQLQLLGIPEGPGGPWPWTTAGHVGSPHPHRGRYPFLLPVKICPRTPKVKLYGTKGEPFFTPFDARVLSFSRKSPAASCVICWKKEGTIKKEKASQSTPFDGREGGRPIRRALNALKKII
jgi:hypothetical protein